MILFVDVRRERTRWRKLVGHLLLKSSIRGIDEQDMMMIRHGELQKSHSTFKNKRYNIVSDKNVKFHYDKISRPL